MGFDKEINMRKNILVIITIILLLFHINLSYAAFTNKPGARPIGMGGAYVAIADDINSCIYNPAGLGKLIKTEITGMYEQKYIGIGENLNYSYVGIAQPFDKLGTFGISASQSYSELYREYSGILSYGTKVICNPNIYIGGNIKYLMKKYIENEYTRIDPLFADYGYVKTGISFDIGTIVYITEFLSLGAMFENVNRPDMLLNSSIGGEKLELNSKIGLAYKIGDWTPVVEVNIKNIKINEKQDINFLGGMECKFSDDIRLWFGGNLNNVSIGARAYSIENLQLDYALRYPITGMVNIYASHLLQLTYKF